MTDPASDAGPPTDGGSSSGTDSPSGADSSSGADPSDHPHEVALSFAFDAPERAEIVAESVAQEAGEIDDERTAASVSRDGARVVVTVTAADLVALRAGGNTWCSLVSVAERAAAAPDAVVSPGDSDGDRG